MKEACEMVVRHVAEVSQNQQIISRLQLYFRRDEEDRLWLQFPGQVKILGRGQSRPQFNLRLALIGEAEAPPGQLGTETVGARLYPELFSRR